MITLLIVDDHCLVRTGLRNLLEGLADIKITGEAASGEEALRLTRKLNPDVVLMDLSLPGLSGIEITERILKSHPDVRVIVLSAFADLPFPTQILDMGASGYLSKACDAGELFQAIRAVSRGERYIGTEIAQRLAIALLPGTPRSPFEALTSRELEVAMMLTRGMKIRTIAGMLKVAPKTAATYKYRIYGKVGVDTEVELLLEALRHGLAQAEGSTVASWRSGKTASLRTKPVSTRHAAALAQRSG